MIMDSEIVFMDEHYCNDNLKVRGKDEFLVKSSKIIQDNEKEKISVKQL